MADTTSAFNSIIARLRTIGVVHPSYGKITRFIARTWGLILFISTSIFVFQKLVSIFVSADLSDRASHFRDTGIMGTLLVIHTQLHRHSDGVFRLISALSVTEDSEAAEAVAATARRARKLFKWLSVEIAVLAVLIILAPIGKTRIDVVQGNGTWRIVRGMPMSVWYPIEISSSSMYAFLYTMQSLPVAAEFYVYTAFIGVSSTVCFQLCTHFRLLGNQIMNCRNREIKKCIRRHQLLLGLVKEFSVAIKYPIGMYAMVSAGNIAATTFEIITVERGSPTQITAVVYTINLVLTLLLYCQLGEVLTVAGDKFFIATIFTPWTEMDLKDRKLMITMTGLAARSLKLSGGPFFNISLQLFSTVMKTWYRAFNILLGMM